MVFLCGLNSQTIQFATEKCYVVENNNDIRPYGILYRKYLINAPFLLINAVTSLINIQI